MNCYAAKAEFAKRHGYYKSMSYRPIQDSWTAFASRQLGHARSPSSRRTATWCRSRGGTQAATGAQRARAEGAVTYPARPADAKRGASPL